MAPNPYHIAQENRAHFPNNTTYGAVDIPTLLDLVASCHQTHAVFYDLGSGDGKTLFAVKFAYPHFVVRGIEMIPNFIELSKTQYQRYLHESKLSEKEFQIDFIQNDFIQENWNDATLIFLNATGFDELLWDKMTVKLTSLQPKTKLIITSKTLPASSFRLISQGMEKMSWGLTSTRIYEKL